MKHRAGFVNNSSSSSFILELPQEYDKDWMEQQLFNGNNSVRSQGYNDNWISVDSLMNYVDAEFSDPEAKISTFEQFVENYSLGWGEGPDYDDSKYKTYDEERKLTITNWDKLDADRREYKLKKCSELWPMYQQAAKEGRLYCVGFADEDGLIGCELEHYTPWMKIFKGIGFSHH